MRSELVLALAFLLGCGEGLPFLDQGDGGADADADDVDAGPFVPADHPAFPELVNASGTGGVLTAPTVVPIFYANDELQTGIESLLAQLPASSYWSALEAEYGVGPLTVAPSIVLTDSPPSTASDTDVITLLDSKIGTDPSWPAPTEDTIYFVYYPASTTLTYPGATGCVDFLGYHTYALTSAASKFPFAVAARCNSTQLTPIDQVTETTTHELVEASTDPFLLSYATMDPAHLAWSIFPGAEAGDLCDLETLSYQRLVGTSLVQRFWSNSSAAAGHDPCAPALNLAYFNSIPVLPDQVTLTIEGQPLLTDGVVVPVGTSKTIEVKLFSDLPMMAPWFVEADDTASFTNVNAGELDFAWDKTVGNNGDTLHLTITRLKAGANGGSEFVVYSYQSSSIWHAYIGLAGN